MNVTIATSSTPKNKKKNMRKRPLEQTEDSAEDRQSRRQGLAQCTTVLSSEDMLSYILQFLPAEDKCRTDACPTVSQQWRRACRSPAAWHTLDLTEEFVRLHTDPVIRLSSGPTLRAVRFDMGNPLSADQLEYIGTRSANVCRLEGNLGHAEQKVVAGAFRRLSELRLLCPGHHREEGGEGLEQLEGEAEPLCDIVINRGAMQAIGERLLTFQVQPCRYLRDETVLENIGDLCPNLQRFTGPVNVKALYSLVGRPLRMIDVELERYTTSEEIERIYKETLCAVLESAGPHLVSVTLDLSEYLLYRYSDLFETLAVRCPQLQYLFLQNYPKGPAWAVWEPEWMARFMHDHSATLKELWTDGLQISGEALQHVAQRGEALELLYIKSNHTLRDSDAKAFCNSACGKLRRVTVRKCSRLTQRFADALVAALPALESMVFNDLLWRRSNPMVWTQIEHEYIDLL